MTPGIQPKIVRMMQSIKEPMRPVVNTAAGGNMMQRKKRIYFLFWFTDLCFDCTDRCLLQFWCGILPNIGIMFWKSADSVLTVVFSGQFGLRVVYLSLFALPAFGRGLPCWREKVTRPTFGRSFSLGIMKSLILQIKVHTKPLTLPYGNSWSKSAGIFR